MSTRDTSEVPRLPMRDPDGHKGTFGTVCVVGGCAQGRMPMIGAPVLAGRGAFRAGCGLVKLAMPSTILAHAIEMLHSATGLGLETDDHGHAVLGEASTENIAQADAIVIGPGLGADEDDAGPVASLVMRILEMNRPTILDADALNALASGRNLESINFGQCVLTPHPGEFARLADAVGLEHDLSSDAGRSDACAELASRLGCAVVLKGARTVISDGNTYWTCTRGHPCMATGGTGDVLAGVIASFAAQLREREFTLYDIARVGVYAHAHAGERWARLHEADAGMLAEELADELPAIIAQMRSL